MSERRIAVRSNSLRQTQNQHKFEMEDAENDLASVKCL